MAGEWATDSALDKVRAWWTDGLSAGEIGTLLGVTRGAIIGKIQRLKLPPRPDPSIGRKHEYQQRWSERRVEQLRAGHAAGHTWAAIGAELGMTAETARTKARSLCLTTRRDARPTTPNAPPIAPKLKLARQPTFAAPPPRVERPIPRYAGKSLPCSWPIGVPKTKAFRFCDDVSLPGKSYCDEHQKLAFVKVRDRRQDADQPAMGGD